jgi:hypothetical protein
MPNQSKLVAALSVAVVACSVAFAQGDAPLPSGVRAVWDFEKAYREKTPTRERVCLNGLWRWQPGKIDDKGVPGEGWGFFKLPGSWPGINSWPMHDCQSVFPHPNWKNNNLAAINAAWYQREISIPANWTNRQITFYTEYLNSHAIVFVDGKKAGEIKFPYGEVDLTTLCQPGSKHVLSMLVIAMPLHDVMLAFNDTNAARQVNGSVERRGVCGDAFLIGAPAVARISDVKVETSTRKSEINFNTALQSLAEGTQYTLRAEIKDGEKVVQTFTSKPFGAADLKDGRFAFNEKWKPEKLWDTHTPKNFYHVSLSLLDAAGKASDISNPVRFGFREFWIDGRDFYLNGTRIYLFCVPIDNGCVGASAASYEGAKESMARLQSMGVNCVYTHNYGCEPGTHIGYEELLRAADDTGMLISFSQPHCGQYDWDKPDAEQKNGYARHAEFYVRMAQNHPAVVFYSMNHNYSGYSDGTAPEKIDGIYEPSAKDEPWVMAGRSKAMRSENIVRGLDPTRVVYHHSAGNLGAMYTVNFYSNFAPVQELSDYFEHWATKGVKPCFTCEYGSPCSWDWTMYRGYFGGVDKQGRAIREFGSADAPWEMCAAQWNAQFLGDTAYHGSQMENECLRFQNKRCETGNGKWRRWDFPREALGSVLLEERQPVFDKYVSDNCRAFRTWGVSGTNQWEYYIYWKLRDGVDRGRKELKVDWENLQRPGFSADYIDGRNGSFVESYERSDWIPTAPALSLIRNSQPLLAYVAGKAPHFTSKDHNFYTGDSVEKQLIVLNNARVTVACECEWSLALPKAASGSKKISVETGNKECIPLHFELPADLPPGKYELTCTVKFSNGAPPQKDSFSIHVLPRAQAPKVAPKIALFDPKGETARLATALGVKCQTVEANADLAGFDLLLIGKAALTTDGAAPDLSRVRDGLRVVIFEQTADVLEHRFGFRVQEYGLRNVFKRIPDHPALAGLDIENLRDWSGEATLLPPKLNYKISNKFWGSPEVKWCGMPAPRFWRVGSRGNVASVLIEKPACGDFLPIVDGGFGLQYSPLMEYREGKGLVVFCQMDVSGRSEPDAAAETLTRNLLQHVSAWQPATARTVLYAGDPAGKVHLEKTGLAPVAYEGGNLSVDQVLVVGPGGGQKLAASAPAIAAWLKAGGNLLAIGLDEADANAILPFKVSTKKIEHINAFFEPFGSKSLMAGVGPADVRCNEPCELPLISGGASVAGDGVLAQAESAHVVFCQMAPWQFQYKVPYHLKRTFRSASFLVNRLLSNMGACGASPILSRAQGTNGLYADQPEDWDDPYRYFGW